MAFQISVRGLIDNSATGQSPNNNNIILKFFSTWTKKCITQQQFWALGVLLLFLFPIIWHAKIKAVWPFFLTRPCCFSWGQSSNDDEESLDTRPSLWPFAHFVFSRSKERVWPLDGLPSFSIWQTYFPSPTTS